MDSTGEILIICSEGEFSCELAERLGSIMPDTPVSALYSGEESRNFLKQVNREELRFIVIEQELPDCSGINLLHEGLFEGLPVLLVSGREDPKLAGSALLAGASYCLERSQCEDPIFEPLVRGVVHRCEIERENQRVHEQAIILENIKVLLATLKHEINNPLVASVSSVGLLKYAEAGSPEGQKAIEQITQSNKRIREVLSRLFKAASLETVKKGPESVFQVPGDENWGNEKQ